mmetsp:Transcript_11643/g.12566  ORF Transcript_11643/g.12566 Transcript_11643/m.12566 type:complete len:83 (-) Transcript_11643:383-631(-)
MLQDLELYFGNISGLSHLKRLHLSAIIQSTITDVSFLRNIQTVELRMCNEIIDVSPLHFVKNLVISYCFGIKDISIWVIIID